MWTGSLATRETVRENVSRASFELKEEDIEAARAGRTSGHTRGAFQRGSCPAVPQLAADFARASVLPRRSLPTVPSDGLDDDGEDEETKLWQVDHPNILESFDDFVKLLEGKRLVMFLDYDGTLAPIVSNPDQAFMSDEMRAEVRRLAQSFPTAIISGRGREKVEQFVQLAELYYAGSHGMDIVSPKVSGGEAVDGTFQPAAKFKPLIDQVYHDLTECLSTLPGSSVEHNVFCVSAHFRNCVGESWQDVVAAVEAVVARHGDQLRITRGRKVVEVRPMVDWHKGTALRHLLEVLHLHGQPDVMALYIGDDKTDEDAFKELRESKMGLGILVSSKVKATEARYTLRDPHEVQLLLTRLVAWGTTQSNGWLQLQDGRRVGGQPADGHRLADGQTI